MTKPTSVSKLSPWQKEKIDKILNNMPKKALGNPSNMEKIYAQTIKVLEPNNDSPKPNILVRKRKGSTQEFDMEEDTVDNEATTSLDTQWRTTKKTCKLHDSVNNNTPSIYASNITLGKAIDLLKAAEIQKNKFHIKKQNEDNIILFAHDLDTYDNIKNKLINKEIQFFTYTPKHRRPKSLILKGIKGEPEAEAILEELKNINFKNVNVTKVAMIKYNKNDPTRYHYLVQLTSDSVIKEITNIKYLAYQKVRWEKPRKKIYCSAKDAKDWVI
ncbi:hypothetical protein PV325_009202 [Microctonus aethiopoides]|nr:hypothetical protein PV325_009202 [Microctonus aethiopoides]